MAIKTRPPVVVVMGHIDHGKSTLLDYIRKSKVTASEAGGITQHLGAYEVAFIGDDDDSKSGTITFLDTPGHAAFVNIRNRGASAADIAILVVSAEDGVKPQTVEAYKSIQASGIPYIVAITKIDKPNANIERTKISLAENEIYLEGYGGSISWVPVSAITGEGIPELLEMIHLQAEVSEFKSDYAATPRGVVIEANMSAKKGIAATVIIKDGILKSGMYVLAGKSISPVRIFENCYGFAIKEAMPGRPAVIIGFDSIPEAGAEFIAFANKKEAEKAQESAVADAKEISDSKPKTPAYVRPQATIGANGLKVEEPLKVTIPIIIKADTVGSLDGIKHELEKIKPKSESVFFKIVYEGIGDIGETDAKFGVAHPDTYILGFNVAIDNKAAAIIERNAIKAQNWNIIYKLMEFLEQIQIDRKPKYKVEEDLGLLKIMQVFGKDKDRQIVGGKVQKGSIKNGAEVKILRREAEIGRGKIRELQQSKKRQDEVMEGFECGLMVEAKIEIAIGDKIQCFQIVEK